MADDFMRHVRLRRVERRRMVSNVLRGEKHAVGQRFKKDARLDESGHRLKPKATESLNLRPHFSKLRDTLDGQVQTPHTFKILCTGVRLMRGFEWCRMYCVERNTPSAR